MRNKAFRIYGTLGTLRFIQFCSSLQNWDLNTHLPYKTIRTQGMKRIRVQV